MSPPPRTEPLTIVHVTAPAPVGGLESVVTALARGHGARGHDVHVVSVFNVGERAFPLADGVSGVTTHVLEIPPRRYSRERAAVADIARDCRADVLHTHGYRPDVVDAGAAHQLGVPVVTTVHGFAGGGLKSRLYEWIQERAFRRFDAIVAVSRPLVVRLESAGVPAAKVHWIQNAWAPGLRFADRGEARRELSLPAEGLVAAWVGRLSREKAPDLFLAALARMGPHAPVAAFIGDGPMAGELHRRATALGLGDRVRWYGVVNAAARLLPAFDAYVLSSRTEGTPIVLLEAMAAGVPVIATRVGGVPDVVSPVEAVLVPPEDPETLARALHELLSNKADAALRASAARLRLRRDFAEGPWLERYEQLYRSVIDARR